MAERWSVVRGRTAIVAPPNRVRTTWLITGLKQAYCRGKAPETAKNIPASGKMEATVRMSRPGHGNSDRIITFAWF